MTELEKFRLDSNGRLAMTRWLFLLLGIFSVGIFVFLNQTIKTYDSLPTGFLMFFFVSAIILNFPIYFLVSAVQANPGRLKLLLISGLQIGIDFLGVTILIYILGGPGVITAMFYFLPIIESIILFEVAAPITLAVLATSFLNGFVYFNFQGLIIYPTVFSSAGSADSGTIDLFTLTTAYSVVYVFLALIFSYNYQFIRPIKIFQKRAKEIEKKMQSQNPEELEWLKKMNEKIEKNNRAIYAKDLELKLAKQQLDKLEQAKSKFISVTTHQLRTPLSAIKWTFNMILSNQLGTINEEQKEFLQKGYNSTQRMIAIVNNLLNLDHIKGDGEDLNFIAIQFEELVENVAFEFANQLTSKNIKLIIKRPEKLLPMVEADPNQIRMVMENLLDNAIKYTPKNGEVTIQIKDDRINTAQRSLEVVVKDTGIGIPEEEQKKIFYKFFRASNAISEEPDGSGFGLFISKDVVERHGGTMWFESVIGKGTAFHFTLPLKHSVIDQNQEISEIDYSVNSEPVNLLKPK